MSKLLLGGAFACAILCLSLAVTAQEEGGDGGEEQAAWQKEMDTIKATLQSIRGAADQETREKHIDEIFSQCGAFLDEHAAAADEESLTMAAGIWFEVAGMKDVGEEEVMARVNALRAMENLPDSVAGVLNSAEAKYLIAPGKPAPNWTAVDVHDGKEVTLEGLRGKLVLMDFWATWCPPCRSLMKERLQPIHQKYGEDERFLLVGLGLGWRGDTAEKQAKFGDDNGYGWLKVFNEGDAGSTYGVRGIPFLCLVDEKGTILVAGSGWGVIDEVDQVLAQRLDADSKEEEDENPGKSQ